MGNSRRSRRKLTRGGAYGYVRRRHRRELQRDQRAVWEENFSTVHENVFWTALEARLREAS